MSGVLSKTCWQCKCSLSRLLATAEQLIIQRRTTAPHTSQLSLKTWFDSSCRICTGCYVCEPFQAIMRMSDIEDCLTSRLMKHVRILTFILSFWSTFLHLLSSHISATSMQFKPIVIHVLKCHRKLRCHFIEQYLNPEFESQSSFHMKWRAIRDFEQAYRPFPHCKDVIGQHTPSRFKAWLHHTGSVPTTTWPAYSPLCHQIS